LDKKLGWQDHKKLDSRGRIGHHGDMVNRFKSQEYGMSGNHFSLEGGSSQVDHAGGDQPWGQVVQWSVDDVAAAMPVVWAVTMVGEPLVNGSFEDGLNGWTILGTAGGYDDPPVYVDACQSR
jgi:hypothetical protein